MSELDADDLAMLAAGFGAAMEADPDGDAASAPLYELGWDEVLATAPAQAAATAFAALGTTGSAAGILDDVLAHALGLEPAATTAVLLPSPGSSSPAGRRTDTGITIDGMASSRLEHATTALLAVASDGVTELVRVDASLLPRADRTALDPGRAYRRLRVDLDDATVEPAGTTATWDAAVGAGRSALAHQLVAASRTMLDQARTHAVDRVQFARPVASFQAVRHKLAEALVHIEGAAAVADVLTDDVDPLLAALAKSLAGRAARTTATNAQQVLAGIGFTTDHPFHRWLKRTIVVDLVLGSSRTLPGEIGAELVRRGGAPRLVEL